MSRVFRVQSLYNQLLCLTRYAALQLFPLAFSFTRDNKWYYPREMIGYRLKPNLI